jgi:ferredoxin
MITLKINNQEVQVENGTSVMKAAQQAGVEIPNLCWHDELEHFTSCMLCLVKDSHSGKLFPSCSVQAADGQEVITDDDEITEARKTALELLLSEHVGDCEAPCQIACPAHMNIPLMNRLIASGKFNEALDVVMRDIALPAVLGRICPAPCEGACHRKTVDEPVSICLLKRYAGDTGEPFQILPLHQTDWHTAVIGAGPAGLAAAYYLQLRGIHVTLFDRAEEAGGQLRTKISEEVLPREVLNREVERILKTGVRFMGGTEISAIRFAEMQESFDAIVVATGTPGDKDPGWGLQTHSKGILTDRYTYQTSVENVFAIGNSLRSSRLAVRSVGQGKEVAFSIWQYLNGQPVKGEPRTFNSRFGKLVTEEFAEYLKDSVRTPRIFPDGGYSSGFSEKEAVDEAERCMHCDCRAVNDCRLRQYSHQYDADQRRFKTSERRRMTRLNTHTLLIYEPQKCIKCGICVRLAEKYGETFGFTYIGRGFDVEVGVPFNDELSRALTQTAQKVAEGCPTGAIELKEK